MAAINAISASEGCVNADIGTVLRMPVGNDWGSSRNNKRA